jgi:hypothetical protein
MVMIFLYLVIPLITYLVSLVQNASLKNNDPWCFFFLPSPPYGGQSKGTEPYHVLFQAKDGSEGGEAAEHQKMLKILFLNFFVKKLKKKGHLLVKLLFLLNSKYIISKLTLTSRKSRVSWTQSVTSSVTSSKSKVLQVNPMIRPARDPEKQEACANSSGDLITCDQTRNKSPDTSHVPTRDKSRDPICFG